MTHRQRTRPGLMLRPACLLLAALCAPLAAAAQDQPRSEAPAAPARPAATVDVLSVVKVRSRAVAGARSAETLGVRREGSGVVISADGLVLTIGYLILEAESVELSTAGGTVLPATVVAYDAATGFGLLRSLRPLPMKPVEFGESSKIAEREPVAIAGFDGVAPAYVVSRRPFAGYWEYLLDEAIYTAPATTNWAGAALLSREGKLVGIGSLAVNDALGPGSRIPGNLFVPIDVLKPVLAELIAHGRSTAPPRPWIGVNTQEVYGNVIVARVSPEGPADRAALRPGDVIVRVGGRVVSSQAAFYTRLWSSGEAGVEIALEVLRDGRLEAVTVTSMDRDKYYRPRPTY